MTDEPDILVVRGFIESIVQTPVLSPDEQRRASELPARSARELIAGRSLLRRLLGRWLGGDPQTIRLVEEPDAKPRLADDAGIDFNVAHSGEYVLAAVARGRRVGVDVESVSSRRDIEAIAEAALGDHAAAELQQLPAGDRAAVFTSRWVRIEAVCKATGDGLWFPVDDTVPAGFEVRDLAMPADYQAAVAFDGPSPVRLAYLDWNAA